MLKPEHRLNDVAEILQVQTAWYRDHALDFRPFEFQFQLDCHNVLSCLKCVITVSH